MVREVYGVRWGFPPPASLQFNILNLCQVLAGADTSNLAQERREHPSLLCARTE